MALTAQQEAFAQALASGETQAEAYRRIYPKSQKWKDEAVWSQASRVARKVSARVAELRQPAIDSIQVSYEERLRTYAELAKMAVDAGDLGAAIRAQDSLTKVAGLFAAERPNDRSPIDGLSAVERDKVRRSIEEALAKAGADARADA